MPSRSFRLSAVSMAIFVSILWPGGPPAGPSRSGPDLGAEVDKLFARWDTASTPGGAIVVIQDGQVIYQKGYGLANLEWGAPNTPRTVFCVGSVSKQFTAYAIALLEAEGKLSLDDDYRKYVPEMPDYGTKITIGDLVHHTSGLRDDQMLMYLGDWERGELHGAGEVIDKVLARQKGLLFPPGGEFDYSNANYLLLGEIVRRTSGLSLREFAHRNIFQPLGMTRTFFLDDFKEVVKERAWSYVLGPKGKYLAYIDTNDQVGAGGVHTTAADMALWDANFDDPKAGGPDVVRRVLARGRLRDGTEIGYAFGLERDSFKGLPVVKHDGSYGGYKAMFLRFPGQRFAIFCAANADDLDTRRICHRVARIYLGGRLKDDPVPAAPFVDIPEEKLSGLAGAYRERRNMDLMTLSVRDGRLVGELNEELKVEYAPVSPDEFRPATSGFPGALKVVKRGSAARPEIHSRQNGMPLRVYEPIERAAPSEADLRECEGAYFSEELNATYRFEVVDGKLYVRFKRAPRSPLRPLVKDQFAAWPLIFDFIRNGKGSIGGFRLGRIGPDGIPFVRLEGRGGERSAGRLSRSPTP